MGIYLRPQLPTTSSLIYICTTSTNTPTTMTLFIVVTEYISPENLVLWCIQRPRTPPISCTRTNRGCKLVPRGVGYVEGQTKSQTCSNLLVPQIDRRGWQFGFEVVFSTESWIYMKSSLPNLIEIENKINKADGLIAGAESGARRS